MIQIKNIHSAPVAITDQPIDLFSVDETRDITSASARQSYVDSEDVHLLISEGKLQVIVDSVELETTVSQWNALRQEIPIDSTSAALAISSRLGPEGTHKQIIAPEIDMQGWVHEKDADNQDLNYMTFEYYKPDGSGGFTPQASADSTTTRTIAHWEPPYTYYIISGTAELLDDPTTNEIYLNLQGLRGNLAGEPVYNFVQGGIRMRQKRVFGLESNSSREMPYVEMDLGQGLESLHTNRLSFIFDYTAGFNPKVQILITRMVEPGN